jgi:phage shock protein A
MSLLKRITLAVSTQVDRLVGEIENHDAVVEAGIRESRMAYAKAMVRHARMREEGERVRRKLEALRADAAAWRERALGCDQSGPDEEKALECLRRSKRAETQVESLRQTWERHVEVEQRLAREIAAVRQRVESLEHRRQLMRGREATADAASRIRETETGAGLNLDDIFERWEIQVTEAEVATETVTAGDAFEAQFVAEDERIALQAELAILRRNRKIQSQDPIPQGAPK